MLLQRKHWRREHRARCSPFKIVVAQDDSAVGEGRYVVATRNIKAGEVIFEEQPVTAGPKQVGQLRSPFFLQLGSERANYSLLVWFRTFQFTPPVCLGCFDLVDGSFVCPECKWPMCSQECRDLSRLHAVECETLAKCR